MQIQKKSFKNWAQWASTVIMNAGIIPLHSRHVSRSIKTIKIVLDFINKEYVTKEIKYFNLNDLYKKMNLNANGLPIPGLTSVIGCARLIACTGVFELTENAVSFEENTAKSITLIKIKDETNYQIRNIPVYITCINTYCMFAVEHPERLLPKFQKQISFETLIPFCTNEMIDVDTISTAIVTYKVICNLCKKLMERGYSLGLSVRCKDSTSRYGTRFQDAIAECAIECGTQLRIGPKEERKVETESKPIPTKRYIGPHKNNT